MKIIFFCLLIWLIQESPPTGVRKVYETVLYSNYRDTVMLQSMTVKQFKNRLASIETGSYKQPYQVVNKFGYMGKYQISKRYISRFAKCETDEYLLNPKRQEHTMNRLCLFYLGEIQRLGLEQYVGTEIDGIKVTLEGIMAGYHQHPVAIVRWLRTGGKINLKDGNQFPVSAFVKQYN